MKGYTSLEQSKKLAEILPLETADMWWNFYSVTTDNTTPQIIHLDTPWVGNFNWDNKSDNVPCWSLAALLNIIPYPTLTQEENKQWVACSYPPNHLGYSSKFYNNPIDACVAMIEKLHEQKNL